ncbi:PepSY domain-containing protein [Brucella melitensis]|uniref:PepSY domain-containing protein n=1 Tax=Brucella melitensis TaxID=29459 RepID=UPI000C70405D|nr:PepSY domain-containing protein [Brucella melitensis]
MIRWLHRWSGIIAAVLLMVLALSGAALSVFPAMERLSAPQAETGLSVADLMARIQANYPAVEQVRRTPSGKITAYWFDDGAPQAAVIDPATGKSVAPANPNRLEQWLKGLHSSLFLGDSGRIVMAIGALIMLGLSISGAFLIARRTGGWKNWFKPLRGAASGRLHTEVARIAVLGLLLSSTTAVWMSASTFDLLPKSPVVAEPTGVSGETGMKPALIAKLEETPVSSFKELSFPYPGDATDMFVLKTDRGTGYLDQGTGAVLDWHDYTVWQRISQTVKMLHTGKGAALLGIILGLASLTVPFLGITGIVLWFAGLRGRPRIRDNAAAGKAETIVLVGSEGGSTWGFAATLHAALREAGQSVHVGPMSSFNPARYGKAQRILIFAATYGNGDAPASAKGFLDRLAALPKSPAAPLAVLGFGDRSFPDYCAFAKAIADGARAKGWKELIPFETVDRQSTQDFARWGRDLGAAIGIKLELVHQPVIPAVAALTLVSRRDYGADVQAPTAILRFALPKPTFWQQLSGAGFSRFEAGDLLGIVPEGSAVPRFYSLASGSRDGFVEIVVKKHPAGLCSGQLFELQPGDTMRAFLRRNANFHAGKGRTPLILVGAGTGIGPLAGIVRANRQHRPVHLFFGMRHPESDFFYHEDLQEWQGEGRLQNLTTACSRVHNPSYVQDALRKDAAEIARLVNKGARVMVCGGRDMAAGVSEALADILAPAGLTPAVLKAEGRYVEDVY